jgi:hypothetical protein
MICVWSTSVLLTWGVASLRAIITNMHTWASRILKPRIQACIFDILQRPGQPFISRAVSPFREVAIADLFQTPRSQRSDSLSPSRSDDSLTLLNMNASPCRGKQNEAVTETHSTVLISRLVSSPFRNLLASGKAPPNPELGPCQNLCQHNTQPKASNTRLFGVDRLATQKRRHRRPMETPELNDQDEVAQITASLMSSHLGDMFGQKSRPNGSVDAHVTVFEQGAVVEKFRDDTALLGQSSTPSRRASDISLFGVPTSTPKTTGGLFDDPATALRTGAGIFSNLASVSTTTGGLFGNPASTPKTTAELFNLPATAPKSAGRLFSCTPKTTTGPSNLPATAPKPSRRLLGHPTSTPKATTGRLDPPGTTPKSAGGLFGSSPETATGPSNLPATAQKPPRRFLGHPTSTPETTAKLFHFPATAPKPTGGVYGNPTSTPETTTGLLNLPATAPKPTGGLFRNLTSTPRTAGISRCRPLHSTFSTASELFRHPIDVQPTGIGLSVNLPDTTRLVVGPSGGNEGRRIFSNVSNTSKVLHDPFGTDKGSGVFGSILQTSSTSKNNTGALDRGRSGSHSAARNIANMIDRSFCDEKFDGYESPVHGSRKSGGLFRESTGFGCSISEYSTQSSARHVLRARRPHVLRGAQDTEKRDMSTSSYGSFDTAGNTQDEDASEAANSEVEEISDLEEASGAEELADSTQERIRTAYMDRFEYISPEMRDFIVQG